MTAFFFDAWEGSVCGGEVWEGTPVGIRMGIKMMLNNPSILSPSTLCATIFHHEWEYRREGGQKGEKG